MQCSASIAQTGHTEQPKPGSPSQFTLRMDAKEVVLNCTVLNNKGELVNIDRKLWRTSSFNHSWEPVAHTKHKRVCYAHVAFVLSDLRNVKYIRYLVARAKLLSRLLARDGDIGTAKEPREL
jgi:hypothetical protein